MILNVSGRCDIVAFYASWFMNRYRIGYVDVRNPFYRNMVSRINFEDVELIVFCTKNPLPIIGYLDEIKIPILFHVTLNQYKREIEPNVIDKRKIIEGIKEISLKLGKDKVFLRYDPIFLSEDYTVDYHIKAFSRVCKLLEGYVSNIIISFIDDYKNVRKNQGILRARKFEDKDFEEIGNNFFEIASNHGMTVQTCSEDRRLLEYGFVNRDCVSKELASSIIGRNNFKRWKARGKDSCHCVEMVDIGVYNSCQHRCKYCYANYDEGLIDSNFRNHHDDSSLLVGYLESDDVTKERKKF